MRCLYCGKQLAFFRRLTGGGEFCSDPHKASYHDEFNRLALARLKQAQDKSDELRAAPPNQLALIRRGQGEPEGPNIRSNAHWIEPKSTKPQLRKTLAIAAPERQAQPDPNPGEFLSAMPAPVQPVSPELGASGLAPLQATIGSLKPEWTPPVVHSQLAAAGQIAGTLVPLTAVPEPDKPAQADARGIHLDAVALTIDLKPEWNPPRARIEVAAADHIEGTLPPLPREYEIRTAIPVSSIVEMKTPDTSIPCAAPQAPLVSVYPSLPSVDIDPLRFAPTVEGKVEIRSQFLPFHFDFTAFPAPDFDILEPAETPVIPLKTRNRAAIRLTGQEHALNPAEQASQPVRRRGAAVAQILEMGTLGKMAGLASPTKSLYPRLATTTDQRPLKTRVQPGPFRPQPPAIIMPRSGAISFRANDQAAPASSSAGQDDERLPALKLKLAVAPTIPPAAPIPEPPVPGSPGAVMASHTSELKPVERSTAQQPAQMSPPRRRTVAVPSILELPSDFGEEQKSLWGALRKYLGK